MTITEKRELTVGELRTQVSLGTEAVYRVCGWDDELAEVEVVRAPGLTAGRRLRLTLDAVAQMDVIDDPGAAGLRPEAG